MAVAVTIPHPMSSVAVTHISVVERERSGASHLLEELDGADALPVVPRADHHHAIHFVAYLDHDLVAQ